MRVQQIYFHSNEAHSILKAPQKYHLPSTRTTAKIHWRMLRLAFLDYQFQLPKIMQVGTYCCLIIAGAKIYCKVLNAASGGSFLVVDCLDIDAIILRRISQDFYASKLVAQQKP